MSPTDCPDADDLDHRQRPLDRDRDAAGSSIGPTIRLNEKFVGCGCFGCSSLVVCAGGVILLVLVAFFLIPDWRVNNRYVEASCVVLDRRVESRSMDVAAPKGQEVKHQDVYRPEIQVRYEVKGRKFETWCYHGGVMFSPDRAAQQAIAESFQVGMTYPCWYDPDRPEQVILVRGHNWGAYIFLIVTLGFMAIGVAGMWMARAIAVSRPGAVAGASSGSFSPSNAPPVAWPIQKLQSLGIPHDVVDPARFGDPIAMKAEWSPLTGTGGNLRTHRLVEVDPDRLAFRATGGGILFALMFILVGGAIFCALISGLVSDLLKGNLRLGSLVVLPIAPIFCVAGGYMLYSWTSPVVFDSQRRLFWKGRKEPDEEADASLPANAASFKAIHALQLISNASMRYRGYEMNLVMADGERVNVIVYESGSRNRLRADAATLGSFLGKPVWDAL